MTAIITTPPHDLTQHQKLHTLRPYQKEMVRQIYDHFREKPGASVLSWLPTGGGKTAIGARIMRDAIARQRRVLFLIHRDSLIDQTQRALAKEGLEKFDTGIIKADIKPSPLAPVQIASIQTLSRRKKLDQEFDLVIIDECHTICWHSGYDWLKERYQNAWKLGLTATPWRMNFPDEHFSQHFDFIVQGPSVKKLIADNYLTAPRYFGFGGIVDLSKLEKSRSTGDYKLEQQERLLIPHCDLMAKLIVEKTEGRKGIVFCSGVNHSLQLAAALKKLGETAEHLDADTDGQTRAKMYSRIRSGQTRFLCNVAVLTEGFDVPDIGAIILIRQTMSKALYTQMLGRGLRIAPGKEDVFLLDFGTNITRLGYLEKNTNADWEPKAKGDQTIGGDGAVKECPQCHNIISNFLRICPHCDYEFADTSNFEFNFNFEKPPSPEEIDLEFGEFLSFEAFELAKYARQQRRTRFTNAWNPDGLWHSFHKKFPGEFLVNQWLIGAIFQGRDTAENRQKFLRYLEECTHSFKQVPSGDWFKTHIEIEFGEPGKKYKVGNRDYKPSNFGETNFEPWHKILQVPYNARSETIKQAYVQLAKRYHPDTCEEVSREEANRIMQRINWAYSEAKARRLV